MTTALAVTADLRVAVEGADGATTRGTLRGTDSALELRLDSPGAFAGRKDVAHRGLKLENMTRMLQ